MRRNGRGLSFALRFYKECGGEMWREYRDFRRKRYKRKIHIPEPFLRKEEK